MAQQVQVVLIDDLDGGEAEETVGFALDGVSYEIDLSADNAARLRNELAEYIGQARKVGRGRRRGAGTSTRSARRSTGGATTAEIRKWARSHGYTVSDRGRIPAEVMEAYGSAN